MWSLIKWAFFLGIIACVVLWYTGYKVKGKTIQEHLAPYTQSKMLREGIRDIRSLVGEGLKAAGEAVSEDVTDSERKQLDNLVKQELNSGKPITGVANQKALPPEQTNKAAPEPRPKADLVKDIHDKIIDRNKTLEQAVGQTKEQ